MLNLLVETKNEYISHLTNIITPLIFEGIQSIYKEAQKLSDATDVLKIFQTFLKRIPKWNKNLIEKETLRIMNSSHSYEWLDNLIKATLKSNLVVLMYNPTIKNQHKIDSSFYNNISSCDFIHKVYIECAREIWNNPYLLYHNYPPIEIKRNQRDCMTIIKECIKEALRKLLPVKHILNIYLGEDVEEDIVHNNFEKNISDVEKNNLIKIINKDLLENNKELEYKIFDENINNNTISETNASKTIGSKILNIIKLSNNNEKSIENKNDNTLLMKNLNKSNINDSSNKLSINSSSITETLENNSIDGTNITGSLDTSTSDNNNDNKKLNNNLDYKIKKILNNDSDFETSLTDNNKYQDIFSNSDKKLFTKFMNFE